MIYAVYVPYELTEEITFTAYKTIVKNGIYITETPLMTNKFCSNSMFDDKDFEREISLRHGVVIYYPDKDVAVSKYKEINELRTKHLEMSISKYTDTLNRMKGGSDL